MKPIRAEIMLMLLAAGFPACLRLFAGESEPGKKAPAVADSEEKSLIHPCPDSFLTKTRTARTVGKARISSSLTAQHIDYDQVMGKDGDYRDLAWGDENRKLKTTLTVKYGWARHHHVALGIPYLWNDIDIAGKVANSRGFGNVFLFEKWNCIRESKYVPAVSVDAWYYMPTGDTDRKLGSSRDAAKFTAEVSKTWKYYSVHFNPGYTFQDGSDVREVNAAILLTPTKKFWPMAEYNFTSLGSEGDSHDIVPGIVWRFSGGGSLIVGAVINAHSSMKYRDTLGAAAKISYRF